MAHVGKVYKLWFRRDAAWELNNYTFGWPEAYFAVSHGLITSARYAVSQFAKVFPVNLHKDYVRKWTSEQYGGFFDNVYWNLEFPGVPDEPLELVRFSIWHGAIIDTPLFDATYRSALYDPDYHFWRCGNMIELHFLSPDVQVDPERFNLVFAAARWDKYPPP